MSNKKMFFGTLYSTMIPGSSSSTVNARMSYVPAPDPGMGAGASGYSELLEFENGGADVVSSAGTHRNFEMDWNLREASGADGLDIVRGYQQRLFGPGLIYFADPMNFTTNLLPPAWASPGLIEQGWKGIFSSTPTYSNVSTNSYSQPSRKIVYPVAVTASAVPTAANQVAVLVIPSDHTLHLGFSAAATGTAVIRVRPINLDGSYASTTDLTLLTDTSSTRMNATFAGSSYKAVEIYITRTSTATSTMTITSGMAQLWPTSVTPTLIGNHIPGAGFTGCKFGSEAIVESYVLADNVGTPRHYKGMSVDLVEVGAWQRTGT